MEDDPIPPSDEVIAHAITPMAQAAVDLVKSGIATHLSFDVMLSDGSVLTSCTCEAVPGPNGKVSVDIERVQDDQ